MTNFPVLCMQCKDKIKISRKFANNSSFQILIHKTLSFKINILLGFYRVNPLLPFFSHSIVSFNIAPSPHVPFPTSYLPCPITLLAISHQPIYHVPSAFLLYPPSKYLPSSSALLPCTIIPFSMPHHLICNAH